VCKKETYEETIFNTAVRLQSHAEREAYLSEACGDDTSLRSAVEELLKHHDTNSFLDVPPVESDVTLDDADLTEAPGTVIGRYKLLEKIGEGGMAVVYMAEQKQPLQRKVALKLIKLGMDTKNVIARFEAERQALALMDHPHIAKVLDAGATDTGRPYFVMELVKGASITQYCDTHLMSTRERLQLFIQVCSAMQHAHQKGIIHRDIKPSNIMVTQGDDHPVPKVIDFGIAKATNQRLTEKTLFTRYAHIIGTPAYMSPEQAELSEMGIDTRSDIYSLGVLLYELLTGSTPFNEEELRKAGYLEMQRVIREQEPDKPSTKLGTLGNILTNVAKQRNATPALLRKTIHGDLDWIVMKALEKVRDRRYDNASALALDVQRHLDDQPILARAPGTLYLVQKFMRRHGRRAVVVLAITLLLGTVIVMSLKLSQARERSAETEASKHQDILTQVITTLLKNNDLRGAIKSLETIADSDHVGAKATSLHDGIISDIREQVGICTEKIENDPEDANNYLKRAQYLHCLDEKEAVLANMKSYLFVLYPISEEGAQGHRLKDFLVRLWASTPTNLGPNVNSSYGDWAPCIANDGLSLLFDSNRNSGFQEPDIWIAKRTTLSDPWNAATPLGPPVDGRYLDASPVISADGLSLYFAWMRASWDWDLCVSTRATIDDNWGARVSLGPVLNTLAQEFRPTISTDGLELFFASTRSGGFGMDDMYVSTRASTDHPWGEPVNLGPMINSPRAEAYTRIAPDGRLLFFSSFRPGGSGLADFWITTRATKTDPWGPPVNLGPTINSPYRDMSYCISADGSALYFCSNRPGGHGGLDLWQISIASFTEAEEKDHSDSIKIIKNGNGRKEDF
jgi:serine/threonine protein kinase